MGIIVQGTSPTSPLVRSAFHTWTRGLNTRESIISIFSHIRDIPYSLVVPVTGAKNPQEEMLIAGTGSCSAKHYLLADMFRNLNLNVVYATFPFLWNDPDLHYPPQLRNLAATLPVAHHLACRVQIGCRWVLVDATWDLPLAKAGFPVNDNWDGYSETQCAVKSLKSPVRTAFCHSATSEPCCSEGEAGVSPEDGEKNHWEEADRTRYYARKLSVRSPEEVERIRRFNREFSSWLVTVREFPATE